MSLFKSNLFFPSVAVIAIAAVSFGVTAFASFSEPATAPPAGNAYAPLNTGPAEQVKTGALDINQGWSGDQQLSVNSNQIWKSVTTGDPNLYLQWSNPGGAVVVGGQSGAQNNLVVYGETIVNPNNGGVGDLYVGGADGAHVAVRTDGHNAYLFPWGSGPTGNVYVGGGGQTTNFIVAKGSLCLNGNCITSWPSSGGHVLGNLYSCPLSGRYNSGCTGQLQLNNNVCEEDMTYGPRTNTACTYVGQVMGQ